ncbi:MAG: Peptidase, M23/M37 family [Parcubacteria bacterium C7867-008]|nr:MAG: Peptidase, M23/M37 family [Parcubacteria bacterium C7867-008]
MIVLIAAGIGAYFLPRPVGAFWPFRKVSADEVSQPILHDPTLELLEAAVNTDPNPTKGGVELALSNDSALMASSGPEGTLPDASGSSATAADPKGSISVYVVKEGDSLSKIAQSFGVSTNTILWANNLTIKSTIRPGMSLVILPTSGIKHTVAKGETLASIAKKFNADTQEIATFNGLGTDASLQADSQIIIPGGEISAVATKAPAKTTTKTTTTKTTTTAKATTSVSAGSGYFTNPVPGALLTQGVHGNNGVDLGAPSGTPIYAAAGGTVIISKADAAWNGGYGSYVVISHANGSQTLYAHMSKDVSSVGEKVSAGELIGYVGATGEATGNHLHFEVRSAKNPFSGCKVMTHCSLK